MNEVVKRIRKLTPEKIIYLRAGLSKNGRRVEEVTNFLQMAFAYLTGRLIVIKLYKTVQPLIRVCPRLAEPEMLRQVLSWADRGKEPKLIVKTYSDSMTMESS